MTVREDHPRRKPPLRITRVTGSTPGHPVRRVGYAGIKNGELLAAFEGSFDVFLTADKNLRYQQNLAGQRLAIIKLPTNRWPLLRSMQARIFAAVDGCQRAAYVVVAA